MSISGGITVNFLKDLLRGALCVAVCLMPGISPGHTVDPGSEDPREVGIEERLGKKVPGDIVFLDEYGNRITIAEFVDRPTLVVPVYYSCPQFCGMMVGNLAAILDDIPLKPGKDYRIMTMSIDERDTTLAAMQARNTYFKLVEKFFPEADWKFLTADLANIRRFSTATGYRFKRSGVRDFVHPTAMIVLARDGTIIRYLYGPSFLPFDIGMALTEAVKGTPSLSVRKVISYCFSYDPENKTYTFRAARFIVLGIILVLGIVMFFLIRGKKT